MFNEFATKWKKNSHESPPAVRRFFVSGKFAYAFYFQLPAVR